MVAALRKPAVRLFIAGCVCFVTFLVARLPAHWLVTLLPTTCTFRCALVNAEGTLWEGRGDWIGISEDGLAHPLTTLHWQWRPPHLGNRLFAWSIDNALGGKIDLTLDGGGLRLSVNSFGFPAEVLPAILPASLPRHGWGGALVVTGEVTCRLGVGECSGQATGNWRSARISSLFPSALGDYRFSVHGTLSDPTRKTGSATTHLNGDITTQRGPLWVTGTGSLNGRQWQLTAKLKAAGENQTRLESMLGAFGTKNPATESFSVQMQN
jgi:hypothetical protein